MYTRVRELRKQKNISQMALAIRIGCSQNAISKIEKGESIPRAEWLVELSKYFGVSIDYILGLTDYRYNMETNNRYTNMSALTKEYLENLSN